MSTPTRTPRAPRSRTRDAIGALALVTAVAAAFPVASALSAPAASHPTTTTQNLGNEMPPPDWVKRFLEADAATP